MSLKQRVAAGLTAGLLAASGLAYSTLTASAYNCGNWINYQKDGYFQTGTYYLHHWLGACVVPGEIYYYAGNDSRWGWGGGWHSINTIDVHLRDWDCAGGLAYDSNATVYNVAYDQLVSPTTCLNDSTGPQTDSNDQEYQPGVFNWWNYLHYP